MQDIPVAVINAVVLLLLVAAYSAIGCRKLSFPYTIGLVFVGLALGFLAHAFPALRTMAHIRLTPNLILYVLLPTLVFDAAVNMDAKLLLRNLTPVLVLAAPGLVIAMLITGASLALLTPLGWGPAMVFGALISATDPVAVIALFKELGAPKRLTMLVDGESLFNDATAIVAFQIMMALVAGGAIGAAVVAQAAVQFVYVFAGGALVGALIGYLMVQSLAMARGDPLIDIAFSTVTAYAAFILAQYYLDLSGVMAVVGAGMTVSWYSPTRLTAEARQYMKQFWGFASFAANSFIFLLLGLTEHLAVVELIEGTRHARVYLARIAGMVLLGIAAILVARAVVVFVLVPLLNRRPRFPRVDRKNQIVMFWGGLRGALPIGLAVSLPAHFPHRTEIIVLTLGVVLFTLLVQGSTMKRLLHRFRLDALSPEDELLRLHARHMALHAALAKIDDMERSWRPLAKNDIEALRGSFLEENVAIKARMAEALANPAYDMAQRQRVFWQLALSVEEQVIEQRFARGFLDERLYRMLDRVNEMRRDHVRAGRMPPSRIPVWRSPSRFRLPAFLTQRAAGDRKDSSVAFQLAGAWADIAARVVESLDRLALLSGTPPEMVQACRAYYEAAGREALDRLERLRAEDPERIDRWQLENARAEAKLAEIGALDELAGKRAYPDHVTECLRKSIVEELMRIEQERKASGLPVQRGSS